MINAQCSVSVTSGTGAQNGSYAVITGQSFKPTCTAKLNNITFPNISNFSDDLRSTGFQVGVRVKDASNTILGNGYWPNGNLLTDSWYASKTTVADFQCANLTLQSGTTYIWEVYSVNPADPTVQLILFATRDNASYTEGNYIQDGVQQTRDLIGWTVNLTTTVNAPNAPVASAQSFCGSKTVASLQATATSGNTLKWYAAATGGTALANSTPITTTATYYVSQSSATCESSRTSVLVTINTAPPQPATFTQVDPICSGATLAALPTTSTNGITGTWSPALNNMATTTYTFAPAAGQCVTATAVTMTIVVNASVTPTAAASQTFVEGATIASLVATPSNVTWYASSADATSGNNALPSSTLLVNSSTYYAVNVVGACRSTATSVTVTVTLGTDSFSKMNVMVYPNPANDVLNIEMTNQVKSIIWNVHDKNSRYRQCNCN